MQLESPAQMRQSFRTAIVTGSRSWRRWVALSVAALLLLSFAVQFLRIGRQPDVVDLLIIVVALLLIVAIGLGANRAFLFFVLNAVGIAGLVSFVGMGSPVLDLLAIAGALVATGAFTWWLARRRHRDAPSDPVPTVLATINDRPYAISAVLWPAVWLALGISDSTWSLVRTRRELVEPASRVVAPAFRDSTIRIGVALSGGGYRAALMHAGVLHMLDSLGIPVSAMSTVSGGSIIGAYYALGGRPEALLDAVVDKRVNLARALIHPVTSLKLLGTTRWGTSDYFVLPATRDYNRTHAHAEMLDRVFYDGARHRHDPAHDGSGHVELMLCMTDIVGGVMVGVTPHGYLEQSVSPPSTRFTFAQGGSSHAEALFRADASDAMPGASPLALLVAASGAFPGAFKPLRVALPRPTRDSASADSARLVLGDGGMADNLGLVLLYEARRYVATHPEQVRRLSPSAQQAVRKWNVNMVIASDGSALSAPRIPRSGLQEVGNAIDVVSRASAGEYLGARAGNPPTVLLSPERFLSFSAEGMRVELDYAHVGGSDTAAVLPNGKTEVRDVSYMTLEPADLRHLVMSMDTVVTLDSQPVSRAQLLAAIDTIVARNGGRTTGTNSRERARNASWADELLSNAVRSDFEDVLAVFVDSPTLTSVFPEHDARALYRLGQYLFILNRPYLHYALNRRGSGAVSPSDAPLMMQAGVPRQQSWRPPPVSAFDLQQRKLKH